MVETLIETRVTNPPLELFVSDKAFRPNPTTVRFSRAVEIERGDVVFDIGTGIGPLAIMAAQAGASVVHAVDPVPLHCELARRNVEKYELANVVHVHHGRFFEPFETDQRLRELKADVIIGDVSGIAEPIAHALGWYSEVVPTGGPDGTAVIIEFLQRARVRLKPDGRIYFPVAVDLSDSRRIFEAVNELFGEVVNALPRPFVEFPISPEELRAIRAAYGNDLPGYITIQDGPRPHWRGQILKAMRPRAEAAARATVNGAPGN